MRMLTLVNDTNSNDDITPEAHGLYKLSLKPATQVAIETKPVFGANITLHKGVMAHSSFIATPDNIMGWVDHGGLSYFSVNEGPTSKPNEDGAPHLPSQFLSADGGILRVTSPTRIYLIATAPIDIHKHGLCFFTPV